MNDRKRAWQVLHAEIRRRASDEENDWTTWSKQIGIIVRDADSKTDLIIELAGFGATFALMGHDPEKVKALADTIGANVIQEPDYDDEAEVS
jgi:hypothetical protein